jgi:sulfide dehydrogenase cytochrome subunit
MLESKLIFAVVFILLLAAGAVQAGGDPVRGQELSIDCADCHGEDGKGDEDIPPIAGLDETKHFEILKAYKSGELVDEEEVMLMFTEELSDQDLSDLAAYYATLEG